MKQERFKCINAECKKKDATAQIVKRHKGYEYRFCKCCGTKYLTHKVNDDIYVVNSWIPRTYNKFD